jgi:hypothetical protein
LPLSPANHDSTGVVAGDAGAGATHEHKVFLRVDDRYLAIALALPNPVSDPRPRRVNRDTVVERRG